ncbi:unnamed protein product [Cuscuta campestris]|uniref:Uncharacterized protein n=1 Tax=Cuscuta campestris TaxID=132261 RepID=A0A484KMX2_9ASTE|nr:unnamed protein product [Cuscuta campestris]
MIFIPIRSFPKSPIFLSSPQERNTRKIIEAIIIQQSEQSACRERPLRNTYGNPEMDPVVAAMAVSDLQFPLETQI